MSKHIRDATFHWRLTMWFHVVSKKAARDFGESDSGAAALIHSLPISSHASGKADYQGK